METFAGWSEQDTKTAFKSYYVVWKQRIIDIVCKLGGLFKSYYVVWKQKNLRIDFKAVQRLNRTMQYGNFKVDIAFILSALV